MCQTVCVCVFLPSVEGGRQGGVDLGEGGQRGREGRVGVRGGKTGGQGSRAVAQPNST